LDSALETIEVNAGISYAGSNTVKSPPGSHLVEQICDHADAYDYPAQQILGIRFFDGPVDQAVEIILRRGGMVAVPAAPALVKLRQETEDYRLALTEADLAIADSGFMVLLWKFLRGKNITRISGLKYLRHLTARLLAEKESQIFWILPNQKARAKAENWLRANRFPFGEINLYIAPLYGSLVEDRQLLEKLERQRPGHIIIGIGNGPQEKLGRYLRHRLTYRPAIHCIGAALAFLTGDQVGIPVWADRFYLGWFLRLLTQPRILVPRLARSLALPWLILRYGSKLPPVGSRNTVTACYFLLSTFCFLLPPSG
jgi:exopolysaccharide biosynthesis WecB/TagA/CpsF family protein